MSSIARVREWRTEPWRGSLVLQIISGTAGRAVPAWLMVFIATSRLGRMREVLAQGAPGADATDVAGRYASAGYDGLTALFVGVMAVLFLVRRPSVRKLPRLAPQVVALLGAYILTLLTFQPVTLDHWAVTSAANLLLVGGMACTVATVLVLGRCFGILPEARGLVTSGPYRYVRHPLYTFEALAFLGLLLPVLSPLSVAIYAAYAGLTVLRARYEEEVLLTAFPQYAEYRRSTRRFIPGVY